jgi:hypothetical protein
MPRNFWSLRSRRSLAKAGDGRSNSERGAYTVSSLRTFAGRRPAFHTQPFLVGYYDYDVMKL